MPPEGKAHKDTAILYLPDVLGIWQNAQLMADQFAANGYLCLIPDLFNGDPIPVNGLGNMTIQTWLAQGSDGKNPHTMEQVDPIVEAAIADLKERGVKKIGAVGYCFGAKVRTRRRTGSIHPFAMLTRPVRYPPLQGWHQRRLHRPPVLR